jgi:hypothetical protein
MNRNADTLVTGCSPGTDGAIFRVRRHPAFADAETHDPLTARLLSLLRLHPNVVRFRAGELTGMDLATRKELLAQFIEVLGLDAPAKNTIPL